MTYADAELVRFRAMRGATLCRHTRIRTEIRYAREGAGLKPPTVRWSAAGVPTARRRTAFLCSSCVQKVGCGPCSSGKVWPVFDSAQAASAGTCGSSSLSITRCPARRDAHPDRISRSHPEGHQIIHAEATAACPPSPQRNRETVDEATGWIRSHRAAPDTGTRPPRIEADPLPPPADHPLPGEEPHPRASESTKPRRTGNHSRPRGSASTTPSTCCSYRRIPTQATTSRASARTASPSTPASTRATPT
jgi:hypothetical protein